MCANLGDPDTKGLGQSALKPPADLQGLEQICCETMKVKEAEMPISGGRPSLITSAVILQKLPKAAEFLSNPTATWQGQRLKASELLDLGGTEAPRPWGGGNSTAGPAGRGYMLSCLGRCSSTHLPARFPYNSSDIESMWAALSSEEREAFSTGKAAVHIAQAAFLPLRTLWLLISCQQPAQSHHIHWYQQTDMSTAKKQNLWPTRLTIHTGLFKELCLSPRGQHKEPMLRNQPRWPNLCCSTGAGQDHHVSLKTVWVSLGPNPPPHWLPMMSCPCINPQWLQVEHRASHTPST